MINLSSDFFKKLTVTGIVLSASFLSNDALANNSNANYFLGSPISVQLEAAQYEHKDVRVDTGPSLKLTIPLKNNWYITGNKSENDLELYSELTANPKVTFSHWMLGAGYQWKLTNKNYLFVEASAETQKLSRTGESVDERGATIRFGGNIQLNDKWQLTPHLRFSDINITEQGDRSEEFFAGAALEYELTPHWQLGASYESGDIDRSAFYIKLNF